MTEGSTEGAAAASSTTTDTAAVVTIAERMAAAGIGAEKVAAYLERGDVQLDGVAVTDPGTPAPWGESRWVISPA